MTLTGISTMPYGKYMGKTLSSIPKEWLNQHAEEIKRTPPDKRSEFDNDFLAYMNNEA